MIESLVRLSSAPPDLKSIHAHLAAEMKTISGCERVELTRVFQDQAGRQTIQVQLTTESGSFGLGSAHPAERSATASALANGKATFLSAGDLADIPCQDPVPGDWPGTILALPLLTRPKAYGALIGIWDRPVTISPQVLEWLDRLVAVGSSRLEHALSLASAAADRNILRTVFGAIDESLIIIDKDSRIVRWNGPAAATAGHDLEAAVGERVGELAVDFYLADGAQVAQQDYAYRIAQSTQRRINFPPTRFSVPGTSDKWLEGSCIPVHDPLAGDVIVTAIRDVTADHDRGQALIRAGLTDQLTGLANRGGLDQALNQALSLARTDSTVAVYYLDMDDFTSINNRLGHRAGDATLTAVARRLETVMGPDAVVARVGGDEFVIVMPGVSDRAQALTQGEKIVNAIHQPFLPPGARKPLSCWASVGVTIADDPDSTKADELVLHADLALKHAKISSDTKIAAYEPWMTDAEVNRETAESLIRTALLSDGIVPYYQPILSVGHHAIKDRVVGAEALVRIIADGTVHLPYEFIDVAESSGLIMSIDEVMMSRSSREMLADRTAADLGMELLSVNLSGRSLGSRRTMSRIFDAILNLPVPDMLTIEITERSVVRREGDVATHLDRLRSAGIRIGLDDCGTDRSSLSDISALNPDFIKIDRGYIIDIVRDDRAAALVAAMIDVADAYGIPVVAEGVETVEQLEAVRTMGCQYAQGYLVGRPMSGPALLDLLRQQGPPGGPPTS